MIKESNDGTENKTTMELNTVITATTTTTTTTNNNNNNNKKGNIDIEINTQIEGIKSQLKTNQNLIQQQHEIEIQKRVDTHETEQATLQKSIGTAFAIMEQRIDKRHAALEQKIKTWEDTTKLTNDDETDTINCPQETN